MMCSVCVCLWEELFFGVNTDSWIDFVHNGYSTASEGVVVTEHSRFVLDVNAQQ